MADYKLCIRKQKLRRYRNWLDGNSDRLAGKPCRNQDGDYLDGWYSPDALIPEFLTHNEAADLRREIAKDAVKPESA